MTDDDLPNCHDCEAEPGEQHGDGCDVKRCATCGGQYISCNCTPEEQAAHDHLSKPWTGVWPGVAECEEFGWFSKFVPGEGWTSCAKDTPGAQADLNKLYTGDAKWDRDQQRFVLRSAKVPTDTDIWTVETKTRDGRTLSVFLNRNTNLFVVDIVDADEKFGNEVVRQVLPPPTPLDVKKQFEDLDDSE